VPILAAFTGSHTDYHTPRDTADKLNYADMSRIARLMGLVARGLVTDEQVPNYTEAKTETVERPRAAMRAYLGSIPEYGGDVKGVLLGGVTADSPLDKAGVKKGDVIVELAGRKVENVYDYTYAIEALKIGQETTITVLRGEEKVELKVTPGRR
jgi:S1-C subfamily serine protease